MDFSALRESGLTEGEVKVYTALLKIGPSTSGPIIQESRISRSIIYNILEKLIEKGLVSYVFKDKTKYFQAGDPELLKEYIEERINSLNKNKLDMNSVIPYLLSLKNSANKTMVQVYEGMKGMQMTHEHSYQKLKKGDEYYYLGIFSFQEEKYHLYWQRDHLRRVKAGINCRLLFNYDTDLKVLHNRNSYKGCDARYMPPNIKTPAWIGGYKDTTVICLQADKTIAIEIVNQGIADSFKAYFEAFWALSKKIKK